MGTLLLLVWLVVIASMVIAAFRSVLAQMRDDVRSEDGLQATLRTLLMIVLCLLPVFVFLATTSFLFLSHPTVQFASGSERGMTLWSMWVHNWPFVLGFSFLQIPVLIVVSILSFVFRPLQNWRMTVSIALLAAILGTFVVALASPRA